MYRADPSKTTSSNDLFRSESNNSAKRLWTAWLGRISFQKAWNLQSTLHEARLNEKIPDTILFLEHDHVITLGKRAEESDILIPEKEIISRGISVVHASRGGQVTYHGPGQLVVYIIANLYRAERELRSFVEKLERATIGYLSSHWNIKANIDDEHPGVWVEGSKIAALGLAVKNKVTMHGLALNVYTDLGMFDAIVACGIRDRRQTSIQAITGSSEALENVASDFSKSLITVYDYRTVERVNISTLTNCL